MFEIKIKNKKRKQVSSRGQSVTRNTYFHLKQKKIKDFDQKNDSDQICKNSNHGCRVNNQSEHPLCVLWPNWN